MKKRGLPCYGTLQQFDVATDKAKFKKICKQFEIPVVKDYALIYPFTDAELADIQYPVVIKPVDNSGARGIFICNNADELKEKYPLALTFSKSKKVIVEKYMNSKEVTINYLMQDGEIVLSAMADRYMKNKVKEVVALPVGYIFPSQYLHSYQSDIDHKVKKMFKNLGIKNGMIFIQSFIENNECIFL